MYSTKWNDIDILFHVAPLMTAELNGPASYGFRAGSTDDAPGYTICIGFAAGG